MTRLRILRGVPASGKSTWAHETGDTVVNRDSLRYALYGRYWGGNVDEDVVTQVEDAAIQASLAAGADTVVDATNLERKRLKTKLSLASAYRADVEFVDFPISLETALDRDANRERHVSEPVIRKFFKRYRIDPVHGILPQAPAPWPVFEPYMALRSLPKAYIIDTDGTVADSDGVRNPYDTSRYHLDETIFHVVSMVRALHEAGHTIIGVSGRDAAFRDVTTTWWSDHVGFIPDHFFMRPEGDTRVDAIVKYELFKQHIEPHFNVMAAVDDRPQVIRMWRSIGVPVMDVGLGKEF